MRLRFLKKTWGPGGTFEAGHEYDVPEDQGKGYLEQGCAEEVAPKAPPVALEEVRQNKPMPPPPEHPAQPPVEGPVLPPQGSTEAPKVAQPRAPEPTPAPPVSPAKAPPAPPAPEVKPAPKVTRGK